VHWQSDSYYFLELTAVVEGFVTNKQDLDLSSNLISSLPASVFANSPLSSLSLANNSLTALQPKLFSGLSNLLHLGKLVHFLFSLTGGDFLDLYINFIQHCFIVHPSDSTVWEDIQGSNPGLLRFWH
jgi:Leucine-rich repeat (LRR) protein